MATNERKKEYDIEYARTRLKRVPVNFQREQYERVKAAADEAGETVSGFIKVAIAERMKRDFDDETARRLAAKHGTSCESIKWCEQYAEGIDIADRIHPGARNIILVDKQDDTDIDQEILLHTIPELEPDTQREVTEAILSDNIEKAKQAISDMLKLPENEHCTE